MAKKWKFELNAALFHVMWLEAVVEAKAEADAAKRDLALAEMLAPTIQDMLETGATPKQIAAVLRKMADAGDEAYGAKEGERR